MSRETTVKVTCDGRGCANVKEIDIEDDASYEDYEIVDIALRSAGWYINLDGDYCQDCKKKAMAYWGDS